MTTQETHEGATINTPEGATGDHQTNVDDQTKTVSYAEYEKLKQELDAKTLTGERLLEEAKASKRSKQKAFEAKQLAEGDTGKVIDSLRGRLDAYEQKEEMDSIAAALQREADKRGCPDWDLMYNGSAENSIAYDKESGSVQGVESFFDKCEADERLRRVYFKGSEPVKTDNSIPEIGNSANYLKDPLGYLRMIQEKRPSEYAKTVQRMTRDGLIG